MRFQLMSEVSVSTTVRADVLSIDEWGICFYYGKDRCLSIGDRGICLYYGKDRCLLIDEWGTCHYYDKDR